MTSADVPSWYQVNQFPDRCWKGIPIDTFECETSTGKQKIEYISPVKIALLQELNSEWRTRSETHLQKHAKRQYAAPAMTHYDDMINGQFTSVWGQPAFKYSIIGRPVTDKDFEHSLKHLKDPAVPLPAKFMIIHIDQPPITLERMVAWKRDFAAAKTLKSFEDAQKKCIMRTNVYLAPVDDNRNCYIDYTDWYREWSELDSKTMQASVLSVEPHVFVDNVIVNGQSYTLNEYFQKFDASRRTDNQMAKPLFFGFDDFNHHQFSGTLREVKGCYVELPGLGWYPWAACGNKDISYSVMHLIASFADMMTTKNQTILIRDKDGARIERKWNSIVLGVVSDKAETDRIQLRKRLLSTSISN